jgi:hypothetical protein
MRANLPTLVLVAPLFAVTVAALPLRAASNLIDNPPFQPANGGPNAMAQQVAPLELRSILKEGAEYEFSLYDPAKKQSTWARLNEPGHEFTVKAFDAEKETVTIEQKNRTYKLTLKESKIALLAMTPGQMPAIGAVAPNGQPGSGQIPPGPPPQAGPFPMGGRGPVGMAPSLTPEQLRNLEADINRRRELRRQAAAAQTGGPPSQPNPGQP